MPALRAQKKHTLYVLNHRGHAPVVSWKPQDKASIKTAEEAFGELQDNNFHLYDVSNPSETGKELTKFDPEAKEVIAFRQLEGG